MKVKRYLYNNSEKIRGPRLGTRYEKGFYVVPISNPLPGKQELAYYISTLFTQDISVKLGVSGSILTP